MTGVKIRSTLFIFPLLCCAGCNIGGFLLSPTASEDKVPAQFKLRDHMKGGIAVVVDQTRVGNVPPELKPGLVKTVNGFIVKKARVNVRYLVSAGESPVGAKTDQTQNISPDQIGRESGAETVLYIRIESGEINRMGKDYYNGEMSTQSVLIDSESGDILWPASGEPYMVHVSFDFEAEGRDEAASRLTLATGHCIVRNFYDCPKRSYRTRDEDTLR